jgi:CubicO group peptidase (beta-lactamase class C family)
MRKFWRFGLRAILVLLVAVAAAAFWKRDDIRRLLAVNSLFAAENIVGNFSNMDDLFFHRTLSRGTGPVSPLPAGPPASLSADAEQWVKDRSVTGLVILQDGQLVHESYHLGTGAGDLRISWSVAKSFLSVLFGIIEAEGAIASLDHVIGRGVQ